MADKSNNKIRKVLIATGEVQTLIGSVSSKGYQDGTNVTARFRDPSGVAFTPTGDALIIADSSNNRIRMLILKSMEVSTLAGPRVKDSMCAYGTWLAAGGCTGGVCLCGNKRVLGPECKEVDWDVYLETPTRLCAYGSSNKSCTNPSAPTLEACTCTEPNTGTRCVADSDGVCTQGGICLGAPGYADGKATNARFNDPRGISVSPDGNSVYVADSNNHVVRRIDMKAGTVSTVAGVHESAGNEDGVIGAATADFPQARFNNPTSLVAHSRDLLMVADTSNFKVRAVSEEDGFVGSLTGWLACQEGSYIASGICYRLSSCICLGTTLPAFSLAACQSLCLSSGCRRADIGAPTPSRSAIASICRCGDGNLFDFMRRGSAKTVSPFSLCAKDSLDMCMQNGVTTKYLYATVSAENITDPREARRCSDGSSPDDMPDNGKPCTCTPSNNRAAWSAQPCTWFCLCH